MSGEPGAIDSEYHQYPNNGAGQEAPPPSYSYDQPDGVGRSSHGAETHRRLSISSESDASSVDEEYEVASIASSIDDKLTWRGRMQLALHSHAFHYTIVALVILDAFIVMFEFLLDLGAFGTIECIGENIIQRQEFCHFDPRFRNMCAAPPNLILQGLVIEPPGSDPMRPTCTCDFREGRRVCVPFGSPHGVNPAIVLHYLSLTILSIFMLEVLLKMIAFRLKYFTHKFEVFDGIVVVISWTLDVASLVEEEAFEAALTFLIILRLWRIIRIVNGSILAAKAKSDNHLKEAKKEAKRIIHAFHKARDRKVALESDNVRLRKLLESQGVNPGPATTDKVQYPREE